MSFLKKKLTSKEKMNEEFKNFAKFLDKKYKNGLFDNLFTTNYNSYKGFRVGRRELFCLTNGSLRCYIVRVSNKEIRWKVVGEDSVMLSDPQDWIYLKGMKEDIRNLLDD